VRPSFHRVAGLKTTPYQTAEHFVPDVHLLVVDDLDQGIEVLERSEYGLVASVFTRDRKRFETVFQRTRLGLLNWNAPTVGASSKLPFGGVKRSGNDRPAGVASAVYCTFPVASLEVAEPKTSERYPGFPDEPQPGAGSSPVK
jgi:succinylglutamic semialdehyde dehydrogenase